MLLVLSPGIFIYGNGKFLVDVCDRTSAVETEVRELQVFALCFKTREAPIKTEIATMY